MQPKEIRMVASPGSPSDLQMTQARTRRAISASMSRGLQLAHGRGGRARHRRLGLLLEPPTAALGDRLPAAGRVRAGILASAGRAHRGRLKPNRQGLHETQCGSVASVTASRCRASRLVVERGPAQPPRGILGTAGTGLVRRDPRCGCVSAWTVRRFRTVTSRLSLISLSRSDSMGSSTNTA